MGPYPAFRWLWRDVLSYFWNQEQHINLLDVTAFLVELRRHNRGRDINEHGKRVFNIVHSLVAFCVVA